MSRRRGGALVLGALALVLGLPALADAQLFPNWPVFKRQRSQCCNESPYYKMVRHEYYGYYPTCWRKFPPGWGCPSAELANTDAAIKEIQEQLMRADADAAAPDNNLPGPGPAGLPPADSGANPQPPPANDPGLTLPRERSPFDLDRPGARPGGMAPGTVPPTPPPGGGEPESLPPPGSSASAAPAGAPLALLDMSERPAAIPAQESSADANGALPSPNLPDPSNPNTAPSTVFTNPAMAPAPLDPAPQRKGFLSGFFDRFRVIR